MKMKNFSIALFGAFISLVGFSAPVLAEMNISSADEGQAPAEDAMEATIATEIAEYCGMHEAGTVSSTAYTLNLSANTSSVMLGETLSFSPTLVSADENIIDVVNTELTYTIGDIAYTATGSLDWISDATGTISISVESEHCDTSGSVEVVVSESVEEEDGEISSTEEAIVLATTTIQFQLETFEGTLYNDSFVVTECTNDIAGTSTTINIWCAIQQLGEQEGWNIFGSWGEWGVTYDINEYEGTDFTDGMWWGWYTDGTFGDSGVNAHPLTEGEHILLTYGIEPTQITISSSTPFVDTSIEISYQSFDWGIPGWAPTPSSTFVINDIEYIDTDGTFTLEITTTTPYSIYAFKDGYITSAVLTITPLATTISTSTVDILDEKSNEVSSSNNGGSGSTSVTLDYSPSNDEIYDTVYTLIDYITTQQNDDGSFVDGGTTDWLLMSFAAYGENPYDLKASSSSMMDYAMEYDLGGFTSMNDCASYPRHILGLLAGGIASNDSSIIALQNNMTTNCHASSTYGLPGINDDVFALLALLATDYSTHADIMTDITNTILADQTDSGAFTWGGFPGVDATGAVINGLVYAQNKGIGVDQTVLDNAKTYLKNEQLSDGGWNGWDTTSDVFTTSWAMMGINAMGESQSEWLTDEGYTPLNPLVSGVTNDGYYESAWAPGPDWFTMKHAIPALLGFSWPIIGDFTETIDTTSSEPTNTGGSGSGGTTTVIEPIVTTTPDIIESPTSTEEIIPEIVTPTSTEDIIEVPDTANNSDTTVDAEPLAIGGGPDEYVAPTPAVAGTKIAVQPLEIEPEPIEEAPEIVEKTVAENSLPSPTEDSQTPQSTPFKVSLTFTVFLAAWLGWRFLRTLL